MFARLLEMKVKPETKSEFLNKVNEEVVPILRKHSGLVDVITMEVEAEPTKIYAITLWVDKLDAEKYEKESFSKVKAIQEPYLTTPAVVRLCKVEEKKTIFKKVPSVAV